MITSSDYENARQILPVRAAQDEILALVKAAGENPLTPEQVIKIARGEISAPLEKIAKTGGEVVDLAKARERRDIKQIVADAVAGAARKVGIEIVPGIGERLEKAAMRDSTGFLATDPDRPTDKGGTPIPRPVPSSPATAEIRAEAEREFMDEMRRAIANGSVPLRMRTRPLNPSLEDDSK